MNAGQEYGADMVGKGNKAIALKNCRHVLLRDFTVFKGGHFALLATGVDHLTIDNVRVDTERDFRIASSSVAAAWLLKASTAASSKTSWQT